MNDGEDIIASVIVKNTGNKTGKEVVQTLSQRSLCFCSKAHS